jgi:Putative death-receptor fusion protein (DUF2428)
MAGQRSWRVAQTLAIFLPVADGPCSVWRVSDRRAAPLSPGESSSSSSGAQVEELLTFWRCSSFQSTNRVLVAFYDLGLACNDPGDASSTRTVSLKEQLQAFSKFRSTLLQCRAAAGSDDDSADLVVIVTLRCGLYRVLLEAALVSSIPPAWRRAVHCVLQALVDTANEAEAAALLCLRQCVVQSLVQDLSSSSSSRWHNVRYSLQEALAYEATRSHVPRTATLQGLAHGVETEMQWLLALTNNDTQSPATTLDSALQVARLLKVLLEVPNSDDERLDVEPAQLLQHFTWQLLCYTLVPVEEMTSIAIAHCRLLLLNQEVLVTHAHIMDRAAQLAAEPPPRDLAAASLVQAWVATLPAAALSLETTLPDLERTLHDWVRHASDPDVRLAAIKALRTLVTKCTVVVQQQHSQESSEQVRLLQTVVDSCLAAIWLAWENPPTRKLAHAIPLWFCSVVELQQALAVIADGDHDRLASLVAVVLAQPSHRKGRYLALETLLPLAGAKSLLANQGDILSDLVTGIGNRGNNTGAIADLWAKFLQLLLLEYTNSAEGATVIPELWLQTWIPPLAQALLSADHVRRKQVAAFCLPRIVQVLDRNGAVPAWVALLAEIGHQSTLGTAVEGRRSLAGECGSDRVLWAQCEVARQAQSLLRPDDDLRREIALVLNPSHMRVAMASFSSHLRVAAFSALEMSIYQASVVDQLEQECQLWRFGLDYASKFDGREYMASILHALALFMDRLLLHQEAVIDRCNTNIAFNSFVLGYLVQDLFITRLGYPGTAFEKESFALALFECILVFVFRGEELALESKLLNKTGSLFRRRRSDHEETILGETETGLHSPDVFSTLFGLLHSAWDSTRSEAYRLLASLIGVGRSRSLSFPTEYSLADNGPLERRAVFLASSPRQREADTGAKMLAVLYWARSSWDLRLCYLRRITRMFEERLDMVRAFLADVVADSSGNVDSLPLAHGLAQALALMLAFNDEGGDNCSGQTAALRSEMTKHFCGAIKIALSVVADYNVEEIGENTDEFGPIGCPDIVNPGAIGANGTFASLNAGTLAETNRRLSSQRIVIGSWLLTKEACGAVSVAITSGKQFLQLSEIEEAGFLLISTITALKHVGAAYAAQRALEKISRKCLCDDSNQSIRQLPWKWRDRLMEEISHRDRVRNSTLRRSTGFALGFQSLMRAEVSSRASPRPLCRSVLASLVSLTLPTSEDARQSLGSFGIHLDGVDAAMKGIVPSDSPGVDNPRSERVRVHALNILRQILLDAPLSREVFPFAGATIVASIVGYVDSSWAVRNSSTMVFAAAMLRSVDADKNATGATSRKSVTIVELFRAYPCLKEFLGSVLQSGMSHTVGIESPVFPVLLLLSRVEPVVFSGNDGNVAVEPFIEGVLACLASPHKGIREISAKVLLNISTSGGSSPSSLSNLLQTLDKIVVRELGDRIEAANWNLVHGAMLAIRSLLAVSTSDIPSCCEHQKFGAKLTGFCRGLPVAPPLVILVVIDILSILQHSTWLQSTGWKAIEWIEKDEQATSRLIGASELAIRVATTLVFGICDKFVNATSFNIATDFTDQILRLVLSRSFDVRNYAIKALKRFVYNHGESPPSEMSTSFLERCILVCETALSSELTNDKVINRNVCGFHGPTVRRLTRCILECWDQLQSLKATTQRNPSTLVHFAKDVFERTNFENVDLSEIGLAPSAVGNCVEICAKGAEISFGANLLDMHAPWRLRHSGALVLAGRLRMANLKNNTSIQAIRLLQDSDSDVRYTMSRSLTRLYSDEESVALPEFILSRARAWITDHVPQSTTLRKLVEDTVNISLPLPQRLDSLLRELAISKATVAPQSLLNTAKNRKIFEEEESNTYGEEGLLIQELVLAVVAQGTNHVDPQQISSWPRVRTLLALCSEVIELMIPFLESAQSPTDGRVHDPTRARALFVPIHSLFLTVACLLSLGVAGREELHQTAREMLNLSSKDIHPLIAATLSVVEAAKPSEELFRESIRLCCFLVRRETCGGLR